MAISADHEKAVRDRGPGGSSRMNAVVAGVLLIVATAASLLSGPFLAPVTGENLADATAHNGQVATGVVLGFIAAFAAPGIAIALYPVLRKFGEGLALGAVAFRIIEGVFYAQGMVILLSLSRLSGLIVDAGVPFDRNDAILGGTMLAQYHGLVDAGLLLAFGVGGFLYYVAFYRSKLIPTWLSVWGIGGVILLVVAAELIIVGAISPLSAGQIVLAVPIGVQEMVLAVWLIVRGFNPAALPSRQR